MAEGAKEIQDKEQAQVERTRSTTVYTPDVDILEKEDAIIVFADIPGADESNVDITLEKDVLTIYARVEPEVPEKHELLHAEYGIGDYQRSFTISNEIDREKIEAKVKTGVLRLVLPKAKVAQTRKITVKAG
ncbi:MAG TPA: Hsp20/alpha crystallin family protein [Syntrophorhabdales bacterium]|nr:Hsp20/alpha crystallin family protein [Syntrophorhabdales bacterium]